MNIQTSQKWNKVTLGDILTLNYGKSLPERARVAGEFPVYGSAGIVGNHNSFIATAPGIIVGRKGSIGEVYLSKKNYCPIDTVFYINASEKYNLRFIYYLLKTLPLKTLNTDAAVPGLNRDVAYQQTMMIPDIATQKQIADVLSAYDDLIENNNRRIKILEEMAQKIYTEWFVNFRFHGHEKVKMIQTGTELGKIPKGWEIASIGDKIDILRGKNITKSTITKGSIPVVAGGIEPAYYHNFPNAVGPVITISASGANAGFINIYYEDIWASDCSYINSKITKFVFFYYSLLQAKQTEVTHLQKGSAQPHVYPKDIKTIKSIFPKDESVIQNFENSIAPLYLSIGNLKKQIKNLKNSRDLLIPKLVTSQ